MIIDADGEPVFAWDELTEGRRQIAVRHGGDPVRAISTGRAGSYPADRASRREPGHSVDGSEWRARCDHRQSSAFLTAVTIYCRSCALPD